MRATNTVTRTLFAETVNAKKDVTNVMITVTDEKTALYIMKMNAAAEETATADTAAIPTAETVVIIQDTAKTDAEKCGILKGTYNKGEYIRLPVRHIRQKHQILQSLLTFSEYYSYFCIR